MVKLNLDKALFHIQFHIQTLVLSTFYVISHQSSILSVELYLLVVVAAGKRPHLQSYYFGAFPEFTQWDPFFHSECRGLCFTLHSTHKRSTKDISATRHIHLYMQGPGVRTQHIPLFIHKASRGNGKDGKKRVLRCSSLNPISQMLRADQTDQKQTGKALTPVQGGNGSKCQSTLGAVPVSCSWTGLIVITLNDRFKQDWGETMPHIGQGWQVTNSNV